MGNYLTSDINGSYVQFMRAAEDGIDFHGRSRYHEAHQRESGSVL